jgi:hypothetical protein
MTWIARFYTQGDLTGTYLEINSTGKTGGYPDLPSSVNNEFSSAEVKPGYRARAFTNLNYTGQELRLDKDPQFGRANYKPGPDGIMRFTYFPDSAEFPFNDTISSIYCEPYDRTFEIQETGLEQEESFTSDEALKFEDTGLFLMGVMVFADAKAEVIGYKKNGVETLISPIGVTCRSDKDTCLRDGGYKLFLSTLGSDSPFSFSFILRLNDGSVITTNPGTIKPEPSKSLILAVGLLS